MRIPAITLAALVPALVAANLGATARWIPPGLGIVVAATTPTEHFLNVGARWRHYRGTVESLKSETWSYLQLAGSYASLATYDAAMRAFVAQTERMIRQDWTAYVSIVNTDAKGQAAGQAESSEETK